jgi:acyl dehydratase
MSGSAEPVFFEDLAVGQVFVTGRLLLTRAAVIEFARQYDPQPMHLSDEGAADTIFERLVASGWQVAALTMRMMVEAAPYGSTPLIGARVEEMTFLRPVYPDIELYCRAEIIGLERSPKGNKGYATVNGETIDAADDAPVIRQRWRMLLPCRTL